MRKSTYTWIFCLVFGAVWFFLTTMYKPSDFGLTLWRGRILWLLAAFLISIAIQFALFQIQKRLLAWRKAGGRDIEDEERYESDLIDHGMISMIPKQEKVTVEDELEK